jgi:signal transduction histidine kinase
MVMEKNKIKQNLNRIFIFPFFSDRQIPSERTSNLLTSFLLAINVIMIILRVADFLTNPAFTFAPPLLVGLILLLIAYLISRTKYYQVGAWLMIIPIPIIVLISIISEVNQNAQTALVFLIIALLMASIFFSRTGLLLISALNILICLLLTMLVPDEFSGFSSVISPIGANLVATALIIVYITHRDNLAKDRQSEMRKLNEELKASGASLLELSSKLEHLVAERTNELENLNSEYRSFAYSISHDLRAPVRAINGFAQIIKETATNKLSPEEAEYLDRIRRSGQRIEKMIESLLVLSRISRGTLNLQEVNLSKMAEVVFAELGQSHDCANLKFKVQENAVTVGDEILLRLVLQNLIDNSIKFSRYCDEAEVNFMWEVNRDGMPVYCVRDNGIGFDTDNSELIFTPFRRLHAESDFDGIGIGLATVRRIIHQHGGQIWAESQPGEGASFYFTINTVN